MKTSFFLALFLYALPWPAQAQRGRDDYQYLVGRSFTDSLVVRKTDGRKSRRDTLAFASTDTFITAQITGVWHASLFWSMEPYPCPLCPTEYYTPTPPRGLGRIRVDVSVDAATWVPATTKQIAGYGNGMLILLQRNLTEAEHAFAAGTYMRVIAEEAGPGILTLIVNRTWPPYLNKDTPTPAPPGAEGGDDLLWFLLGRWIGGK